MQACEENTYQFQQGSTNGLQYFFNSYYESLVLFAQRLCADMEAAQEIVSEAFYKTWLQREKLESGEHIKAYLYTVVKNDSLNCKRDTAALATRRELYQQHTSPGQPNVFDAMVHAETIYILHNAIATLPPRCRTIFELLFIEGKTVHEVAKQLQLSPATVRIQKMRGLDILRQKLKPGMFLLLCHLLQKII